MQKLATPAIIGAFKNTAADVLNAHSFIPPMELQVSKACHRATLRLAAIPDSHPLFKNVQRAAKRRVGTHNTQLHELFSRFPDIRPGDLEILPSTGRAPWTRIPFTTSIAGSKEQAAEEDREEREEAMLTVYSDGSRVKGGVGAAAVLYKGMTRVAHVRYHLGKEDEHTVFEAEAVGMTLGAQMVMKHGKGRENVAFALDNQAVIQALGSTSIQPGAYILEEARRLLNRISQRKARGKTLHIRWVPGHIGIPGNEAADVEAKAAAEGMTSDKTRLPEYLRAGPLPRSLSSVIEAFTKRLRSRWTERWRNGPRVKKMDKIDKNMPSRKYLELIADLPRRQSSIVIQLRTGHAPLNMYLHRITAKDSPNCPHPRCAGRWETVFHYLVECPAYDRHRHDKLRKKHGRRAEKISYLLSDPACIEDTVKYISATKRFDRATK
jgi:ribonuclease HI